MRVHFSVPILKIENGRVQGYVTVTLALSPVDRVVVVEGHDVV
jgi:hypothetical protein